MHTLARATVSFYFILETRWWFVGMVFASFQIRSDATACVIRGLSAT